MVKLSKLKVNPTNPRYIEDLAFETLKKDIQDFPRMLELRPIVVNDDWVIIGGNMRRQALESLGYKEIPDEWVKKASDFTEEELRKFIILDNLPFGKWDNEMLLSYYDPDELKEWGLIVPNYDPVDMDKFFKEHEDQEKPHSKKIILEYSEDDYEKVMEAIGKIGNSPEQVFWKLLKLDE